MRHQGVKRGHCACHRAAALRRACRYVARPGETPKWPAAGPLKHSVAGGCRSKILPSAAGVGVERTKTEAQRAVRSMRSPRGENALNQCTEIFYRRVRLESALERCMRLRVVPRQPWQRRLCPAIPEPSQLEIVLQRLVEQLYPAILRLQIATGRCAPASLCTRPVPSHLRLPAAAVDLADGVG